MLCYDHNDWQLKLTMSSLMRMVIYIIFDVNDILFVPASTINNKQAIVDTHK